MISDWAGDEMSQAKVLEFPHLHSMKQVQNHFRNLHKDMLFLANKTISIPWLAIYEISANIRMNKGEEVTKSSIRFSNVMHKWW